MTAATVNTNRSTLGRPRGLPGRVAVLAACLLAGALGVAHAAAPAAGVPQVAVPYGDLNLASEDGARELYQRIAKAADQVCPYPYGRTYAEVRANSICREAAIARAVREVNNPQLVAVRAEHVKHG
jgi:UrcA family protein